MSKSSWKCVSVRVVRGEQEAESHDIDMALDAVLCVLPNGHVYVKHVLPQDTSDEQINMFIDHNIKE